jgi:V/A-type H+-transporting ATPase subunit E
MTTNEDSTEILRQEILTEAEREAEEVVFRARQEAEGFLAKAAADAEQMRREKLDQARKEADRRSELILSTVPVETARLRAARIEELLGSVQDDARRRLIDHRGFDYREAVIGLAAGAIRRMGGDGFIVRLSEADGALIGDGAAGEIERRAGRPVRITLSLEQTMTGGGVVVEDGAGRQVWDNRLATRLERLWPEMRRHIAVEAGFVPKAGPGGDML